MKISKEIYNISTNCQPVRSNLFVETSATSGLFRCASAFTVDASEARNPASVAENGDFVPTEIMLPYESVMTGAVTQIYVEGIGTSPTWGGDKIKVQVYPCGAGHGCVEDQVSYTVVRCVYKVCVYRPYICLRNAAGAVTNRAVFRTDYSSPSNMVASYFAGQAQFDDSGSFHELPSIKITWVGEGIAYRLYKNGFNGALRRNFRKMESEAMSDLAKTPDIQSWSASTNTLDLRFCDPGWMMEWVDQQNLSTHWAHDRGVTIRYESPAVSDLKKWKNRHEQ